jgi:hypothetical protein
MGKRAIIGLFRFIGKAAAGKLAVFQVIAQTITAEPFTRTGFITAVAAFKVDGLFALHKSLSPNPVKPEARRFAATIQLTRKF